MHYDLHDKNILIEPLAAETCARIEFGGKTFFCSNIVVKLADFALSRIEGQ